MGLVTYVGGLVELQVEVHPGNAVHVLLVKVEGDAVKVLGHDLGARGLGDNSKTSLGRPSEQNLGSSLVVLLSETLEDLMLHQRGGRLSAVHVELDEASRAEGGVSSDSNALSLSKLNKLILLEVGVQLNLKSSRADLGILEHVIDSLGLEVGDSNAAGELLLNELLHGAPGLLVGSLAPSDLLLAVVVPAGRVADAGVDVLEGDGEVDEEEVEVVDLPVGELLAADGLDVLLVVEGLPELGDDEELFALYEAVLDGAGDALAALLLVSVVCTKKNMLESSFVIETIWIEVMRGCSDPCK